jgi:DNA polymerase-3 subunit alpha
MAIKDVARVHELPIPESDRLAKFIPTRPNDMPEDEKGKNYKITIKNCLKCFPEFRAELDNPNHIVGDTIRFAEKLEGNVRNTGVHACGVIIGRDDITDWVPVSTAPDKDGSRIVVTQYEGSVIEETGLIKMDFLGLKTLSIIKDALENIKATHGIDIDIEKIPIDDKKTYQLYCEGKTTGTFQFESAGMQKYLIELQPSTFEDLIAMNALYRPGPMSYIPQFIARKHGRDPITYDFPEMEKYLKDTYGITVYQEQVMLLSRLLAGFTRGESDVLRKAMGKKQIAKLMELKPKFLKGGEERGHDTKTLEKIWADWEKFASYAFNKSHATCYSWVAYQTAYLKANYPSEYMAAVLSRSGDVEKLTKFMDECKAMGITVKGPDINESFKSFAANKDGDIRFGLSGIKGFGANSVDAIISEREKNGPYKDIFDVVERVNLSTCNRRAIEALALSGAFDGFGIARESFFEKNTKGEDFSEILLRYGQQYQLDKNRQSNSLFGDMIEDFTSKPPIPKAEPWPTIERLSRERELVGIYLSAHPLDPFFMEMKFGCNSTLKEFNELGDSKVGFEYVLGGVVVDYVERPTKRGNNFGLLKIEDKTGSAEFTIFDKVFAEYRNYCIPGTAIAIRCSYEMNRYNGKVSLRVHNIAFLKDLKGKMVKGLRISLNENQLEIGSLIKDQLKETSDTKCELSFRIHDLATNRYVDLRSKYKIPLTSSFIEQLDEMGVKYNVE